MQFLPSRFSRIFMLASVSATTPLVPSAQVLTVPTQPAQQSTPPAQAQSNPDGKTKPDPDSKIDPQAEAKVVADLQAKNFADALTGAKAILAANPDSPKANKLVGVVLLDQQKSSGALPYFQKALQLAPDDPTVHGLLLQVYAQAGDKAKRDEQRAILRQYHSDGKHAAFSQIPAFLIETIPVGDKLIQATEFYEPSGEFHFYYRFNIYDANGQIQSFIALESDDADQAIYAQQHPKEAAAGERRFSLDGYSKSADGHVNQALYKFFNGQPSYDEVRALVVQLVQSGKGPLASTNAAK